MVSSLYSSRSNKSNFVSCNQFFELECVVDRATRRNGAPFEITIVLSNTTDRLTVSTPPLVASCYQRLWNAGDEGAVPELLSAEFSFRGARGAELKGHAAFGEYVCRVRTALAHYRCEILECVSEGQQAFAKMRFSGIHVGTFRGHRPSGRPVHWEGAALFRFEAARIRELWVLDDLVGLDALLNSNAESQPVILD